MPGVVAPPVVAPLISSSSRETLNSLNETVCLIFEILALYCYLFIIFSQFLILNIFYFYTFDLKWIEKNISPNENFNIEFAVFTKTDTWYKNPRYASILAEWLGVKDLRTPLVNK